MWMDYWGGGGAKGYVGPPPTKIVGGGPKGMLAPPPPKLLVGPPTPLPPPSSYAYVRRHKVHSLTIQTALSYQQLFELFLHVLICIFFLSITVSMLGIFFKCWIHLIGYGTATLRTPVDCSRQLALFFFLPNYHVSLSNECIFVFSTSWRHRLWYFQCQVLFHWIMIFLSAMKEILCF